jgi:hypothetical protein
MKNEKQLKFGSDSVTTSIDGTKLARPSFIQRFISHAKM